MELTIETLQDTFKIGYEVYEESREEAEDIKNLYHNRQYTADQLATLANRGQPPETFNVVKLFARMLLGYYSTIVNTVKTVPVQQSDIVTSSVLNDLISNVFNANYMEAEGDKLKLSAMLSGLMVSYIEVVPTGKTDEFGRAINKIVTHHVPDSEVVLDPMSRREDYSDANWLHRWKWVSEDKVVELWGKEVLEGLDAYHNHLDIDEADFERTYNSEFQGYYKRYNQYLVVNTVLETSDGKRWSVFWSGDTILYKTEITFKDVRFNYRVHKLHDSDKAEYYGIFREIRETQLAINQALLKIQLMVNTEKAFVEEGAVENIEEFTAAFNRVTGVIPVLKLSGIKVERLTTEIQQQYVLIDKAFDRIQRILSVNDSFLGMAFASDSGRKVKLQQNATIMALRYLTQRIRSFYVLLGWDIVNLIKQYYTATQVIGIADEIVGQRWVAINQPIMKPTGKFDREGNPIEEPVLVEVLDPATGKPVIDENGRLVFAPVPTAETDIAFTEVDITIETTAYNDEDEKAQLMIETVLNGAVGQRLAQINPAGYFRAVGLSLRTVKTKYSPEISKILEETGMMLGSNPSANAAAVELLNNGAGQGGQQAPGSQQLKLPTNTNEGPV